MGRGRRSRKGSRRRKNAQYEEALRVGTIDMMRVGRHVIGANSATKAQYDRTQAAFAYSYEQIVRRIDNVIARIVEIVGRSDPIELLKRAWWTNATRMMEVRVESDIWMEQVLSLRMIDYIQSIIVSRPCDDGAAEISEGDWEALTKVVQELFAELMLQYHVGRRAHEKCLSSAGDSAGDKQYEELYFHAQSLWCNVRGHRYLPHNLTYYLHLLVPHDEVLSKAFGVTAEGLVGLIADIQRRHTIRAGEALAELREIHTGTVEDKSSSDPTSALNVSAQTGETLKQALNDLIGEGLFEIQPGKDVSLAFLDALSLEPGEDQEFFSSGEFCGWPLRVWPIWRKPFLKYRGRFYCFDTYSLVDNLYRVLQRLIIQRCPDYKQEWNRKQQEISEQWPLDLIAKILPGARIIPNVFYRDPRTDRKGQWCEVDAVVQYDDVLLVVEVKAGTFCRESPATDFEAYLRSLRQLIEHPARQAERFMDYLDQSSTVRLYNSDHREVAELAPESLELVVPITVSIDNLSDVAARSQRLSGVGLDMPRRAVWTICLDDLLALSDLSPDPLTFLHFVETRLSACNSKELELIDELDHYGLYCTHNDYPQYVRELTADGARAILHGYRTPIDIYYHDLLAGNPSPVPCQRMPETLRELLGVLSESGKPGRRRVASFLLSLDSEQRRRVAHHVVNASDMHRKTGKVSSCTVYGQKCVTVFAWDLSVCMPDRSFSRRHGLAAMCASHESRSIVLDISIGEQGRIADIAWEDLNLDALCHEERMRAANDGQELVSRRMEKAAVQAGGKIGRNSKCPCGSMKKYKSCHGKLG